MNWEQMNELDELTYRARSLISVVSDGLLSDPCPSSNDDAATVLNLATEKLDRVREIHAEMWEKQREQKPTFKVEEEGEDEDGYQKFTLSAEKEDMDKIFNTFFTAALIKGMEAQEKENDIVTSNIAIRNYAQELCDLLDRWLTEDDFDFAPNCEAAYKKLKAALSDL